MRGRLIARWHAGALAGLVAFASCDVLDNPVEDVIEPIEQCALPVFEPLASDVQRILVEDFTAHQCGNCPPAAIKAAELAEEHPGQVIPLAIHAGQLAVTNTEYPTDWTCEEGDEYWDDLEFQVNPVGRVNRRDTEASILLLDQWDAAVDALLGVSPPAGMQLAVNFDGATQKACVHVHTTWFEPVAGPVRLAILVVESHLEGSQLWYGNDPEFVEGYEFEHMLRGSVTGAKGLVVTENPVAGDAHQQDYVLVWNAAWAPENCELVALLTEEDGSVLQAIAVPVLE